MKQPFRLLAALMAALFAGLVTLAAQPSPVQAADVNGDFSLDLSVNGADMLGSTSFTVTGDETLAFDLVVHDVKTAVAMRRLSVEIFLAGVPVGVISQELDHEINPGEAYRPQIDPVNTRDYLSIWGIDIATGKYKAVVKLEYETLGQTKDWTQSREVVVPGNSLATIAGIGAAIISGIAVGSILALVKSLAGFSIESQALSGKKSLESRARSKVSGLITAAVKKLVVKEKCPVCHTRLQHSFCPQCKKSAKALQKEYRRQVKELSAKGVRLLADGEVKSAEEIPSALGIEGTLAQDVTGTMQNARLLALKKSGRAVAVSALMSGASSGVASVLWVTLGGFSVLSTGALMIILGLSIALPLTFAKIAQALMKRRYAKTA